MKQEIKPFRFAIMGAGNIGGKFCDAVSRIEGCEVAAVASKSAERAETFAKANGVAAYYDSYERMLIETKPDCVYIAVTTDAHYTLSMLCLDYRIPVLCEKAMFRNSTEAEEVFARARELNVFVMEAMWSRFLPAIRQAKQWILDGEIGEADYLDMFIGFTAPPVSQGLTRFTDPRLGGGAAYDITVYAFELTTFMIEQAIRDIQVSAIWGETGVDMAEHIVVRFEHTLASLKASLRSDMAAQMLIGGSKGKIVIPHPHYTSEASLYTADGSLKTAYQDTETENGFVYEIQETMDCIRAGRIESAVVPHRTTIECAQLFDRILSTKGF